MSEPTPYDKVPYASHAYSGSHPASMARMATLFGMSPALPSSCRVLELGSAAGGNILPMAVAYPNSDFVGIDLSPVQIDEGKGHIKTCGVSNVRLETRDILDVGERYGTFDYILCHGVYSWVPQVVQVEIMALCRRLLNPQGVAYISYNCYPGWHMSGVIRDMMYYHSANFEEPAEKISQARALLDFLATAKPDGTDPYSVLLREKADFLRKMSDYYLFHEHLSPNNEPLYFHQFVKRASESQLQFLGEANLATMLPEQFPPDVREVLDQIAGDIMRMEQYMDFVRNRTFRQTLLVHKEVAVNRNLDWENVVPMALACPAQPPEDAVFDDVSEVRFTTDDQSIVSEQPLMKLALAELAELWPVAVKFEELVARVLKKTGSKEPEADRENLAAHLLRCVASGVVEFWVEEPLARKATETPECWSFTRFQIEAGLKRLTTLRHHTADVSPVVCRALSLMDGNRDRAEVVDGLVQAALNGDLSVSKDEEPMSDPTELREVFDEVYGEILQTVSNQSFLVR